MNSNGSASVQAELVEARARVAQADARADAAVKEAKALLTERDALKAELAEIATALEARANIVQATAMEIANTVGQPLEALPAPSASDTAANTLTRAEFDAMNFPQRNEFIRAGGKIAA